MRHGREAVDEYAWMCDPSSSDPEIVAHLEAENAHTDQALAHTAGLQAELFDEIKARIQETDLSVPAYRQGHWYYSRSIEGQQYPVYCRVEAAAGETTPPDPDDDDVKTDEHVLLDANVEAGSDDYFALGIFEITGDSSMLAWASDNNGSEKYTVRFRDLATGIDADDRIEEAYYGSAWSADGRHFFYTRVDDSHRPHEVWRHQLGTDRDADVLVHHEPDERFFCGVGATKDRRWIVLEMGSKITDEIRVCPADDVAAGFVTVVPRRQGIQASIEHEGGTFYILTNEDALDFRVLSVDAESALVGEPDPSSWAELLPHETGVRLEEIDVLRGRLLTEERTQATTRIRVKALASGDEFFVDQDEEVSTVHLGANDDIDWPQLRFTYTSMITPSTVIDLDLDSGDRHIRKVQPVLGGYDPAGYVTSRLWATADDGTDVPISLVHRRDREPGGPTLLYGYGSYEISIDPGFSSLRLSLLDRGWAFAIGHIRGGGEMGRRWYEDGKFAAKPNTFDDFVACGRALVEQGVADPERLAIRGGSAGGLLVGAALNRAPDLWGAVVAEVPFVDALNTILDPSLPLTVIEWEEWGNPVESPEIFDVMASYSPYENIPAAPLPPVLATAGLHDPRVGYWEPAKWVARLRDVTRDIDGAGPFLLKTEMGAGHGGPSGRYDAWKDEALVFAFLLDTLGEGELSGASAG